MEFINGIVVSVVTEAAKRIQAVPLSEGAVGKIRLVGLALSLVATVCTAWASGTLADASVVSVVAGTLTTWLFAVISYHGFIKK